MKYILFITASLFLFGCGVEKTLTTDTLTTETLTTETLTTDILTTNNYTLDKLIVTQIKIQPRQKKVNLTKIRQVHPIPFYDNIDENKLEEVQSFIENEKDFNINMRDEDGDTPLHFAIWGNGNLEIVKILIENGADLNARDEDEDTPLDIAIRQNYKYAIALLRSHGAKTSAELKVEQDIVTTTKMLLLVGLNYKPVRLGFVHPIPFYNNIGEGNLEGIQSFIKNEKEFNINMKDEDGYTPLRWAVSHSDNSNSDNLEIVKILIKNGADVNAEDNEGKTPLDVAITRDKVLGDNQYSIALLKAHGAKTSAELKVERDIAKKTKRLSLVGLSYPLGKSRPVHSIPFYNDIGEGNLEGIQSFIKNEQEFNINMKDEYGNTPLHWAIWNSDNLEVVKILIKNGADLNAGDRNEDTPLDIAVERNRAVGTNQYAIALLIFHAAKTSAEFKAERDAIAFLKFHEVKSAEFEDEQTDKKIAYPIFFYDDIYAGNLEEVQLFIRNNEQKFDINMRNKYGEIPLHFAIRSDSDNLEIVKILIKNGADVNIGDEYGHTPLDEAIRRERRQDNQYISALLRSHGAKTAVDIFYIQNKDRRVVFSATLTKRTAPNGDDREIQISESDFTILSTQNKMLLEVVKTSSSFKGFKAYHGDLLNIAVELRTNESGTEKIVERKGKRAEKRFAPHIAIKPYARSGVDLKEIKLSSTPIVGSFYMPYDIKLKNLSIHYVGLIENNGTTERIELDSHKLIE